MFDNEFREYIFPSPNPIKAALISIASKKLSINNVLPNIDYLLNNCISICFPQKPPNIPLKLSKNTNDE